MSGGHTPRGQRSAVWQSAAEVLAFLNGKTEKSYRPFLPGGQPTTSLKLIEARLRDGASVQDCKGIIAMKARKWLGDPKMREYLRPETLFRASSFESYLGERPPAEPEDDE